MKIIFSLILTLFTINSFAQTENEFPDQLNTAKTNNLVRIAGTKVYMQIPKTYQYIKELARYQKNDKLYIQVIESNAANFNKAKSGFTRQAIEAKGAKIDVIKNIKLNQFEAIFGDGPSKYPDETKVMLVLGDETFVAIVAGVCKTADKEGKAELLQILKSVYYDKDLKSDPLELANFVFDHSITNFKYAMTASGMFMYNEKGKDDANNSLADSFIIVALPKINEEKANEFANDMLWRYEKKGIRLDNKIVSKTRIGNYPAYILSTKITQNGTAGIMYQAVLIGENSGIIFMGSAYNDTGNYLSKFKKTVESIKIK
ncbi:hypothetical protein LX99_04302 [Mucilaginibacter oryzae]|uniref:Uncharacterized protein n=1 Tax=Mucilaginibacter oryzae TaxID=468058 RepID=A0A316H2J8_9SPHI|nr:hypothetical protein [Mucilaginibacter oryzae]PWK72971.1 hypothetical protein LX99_04302 [Mucilaginibacter oryzae]